MKWPLHTNTCIYHSLVQVSLKLQGGLRCWCPSACQNVFLLNLLRNSSVHSDSFANSVYFHEVWLLPLCSSYDRKQAWQEGYKLLQYQTPQYWVFLHAPEKKRKDNEEAVESWEFCGCCSHTRFLQIYMYALSIEEKRPGPRSCTNKDEMSETDVRRVAELKAPGHLHTYFPMVTFLNVFHPLPSLCISGF